MNEQVTVRTGLPKPQLHERVEKGELDGLTKGKLAERVNLAEQYRHHDQGDVARRFVTVKGEHHHGDAKPDGHPGEPDGHPGPGQPDGHADHPGPDHHGPDFPHDGGPHFHHHPHYSFFGYVNPVYYTGCLEFSYFGPGGLSIYAWYPRWTPWVNWCWHYHPHPIWDPRPIWCRPVIYEPAPVWVCYDVPAWTPLPEVDCGTWVDVKPVVVEPQRYDLQVLAVRFVDPGHPEEKLGPRYRVWFRNNSGQPLRQPMNVMLIASDDGRLRDGLPQSGVRVTAIEAGDTQSVDIRLPFDVYEMRRDAQGKPIPFATLFAIVDANREIDETLEDNNGVALAPGDVLPVDPAAFEADPAKADAGSEVLVAGEGFGPEPGKVMVHLGGIEMEAEILGWYDLGVRIKLPDLPLADENAAELVVLRGDGAAANPLTVTIRPKAKGPELAPPAPAPAPAT